MKVRYSIRFRILSAFALLSFICSGLYGFTSNFISEIVNDKLFNWYAVTNAVAISNAKRIPPDDHLRFFITGAEYDLHLFLTEHFGLVEDFSSSELKHWDSIANLEKLIGGEVLYEFKFSEKKLQIVSVPYNEERLFAIYDISGFSGNIGVSGILSDESTPWLIALLTLFITFIGLMIGTFLFHKVMRPLIKLSNTVASTSPECIPPELSSMFYPDEVGRVAATIENLLVRIEKYVKHERRFSREVSHELRTPVTSINISLELLSQLELNAQEKKLVNRISRANRDMHHLIQTFLILGREEPRGLVEESNVRLDKLMSEIIEKHQHILLGKNVKVKKINSNPLEVQVCEFFLDTVISNLVRNAFQYTSDGEVRIFFDNEKVSITDTGSGIPENELERIREPYHKLQSEGIGLGLSIVHRIVEKMQWDFTLRSIEGEGTEVAVRFSQAA